jgi:glucosylceramidase
VRNFFLLALLASFASGTAAFAEVAVVVTDDSGQLRAQPALKWHNGRVASGRAEIVFDEKNKGQSILGFGGAMTDASCFVFNNLNAESRKQLFAELFGKERLNLTVNRVPMGSSDYATHVYSYDDSTEPDPELKKFNIDHDKKYIVPMLKEALSANPDQFLFASPWSPPGWMKSNGTMLGGNMQRKYMPSYAQYFVRFLDAYAKAGVPIKAVTVNNEVDTDQDSKMPACLWPQEYEVDFVRNNLGPDLAKSGLNTKIWLIDHNYNLWGRALASLEEPNIKKYVDGIAWHGYVGDPGKMTLVKKSNPDIDMHWTEGGPDITDPNYAKDWVKWASAFSSILNNSCTSITAWNLALDENGKPNVGPFPCGGLVTVDSKTGEVKRSGQYYALAHFSTAIKKGAVRIASTLQNKSETDKIECISFRNPDGTVVAVLTNPGATTFATGLRWKNQVADVDLPPNSVTTLSW